MSVTDDLKKRRAYDERVRKVEHGCFTPLVFSTAGGLGPVPTNGSHLSSQRSRTRTTTKHFSGYTVNLVFCFRDMLLCVSSVVQDHLLTPLVLREQNLLVPPHCQALLSCFICMHGMLGKYTQNMVFVPLEFWLVCNG